MPPPLPTDTALPLGKESCFFRSASRLPKAVSRKLVWRLLALPLAVLPLTLPALLEGEGTRIEASLSLMLWTVPDLDEQQEFLDLLLNPARIESRLRFLKKNWLKIVQ